MSDELLRRAKVALAEWRPDLIAENCRWMVMRARRDAYGGIILLATGQNGERTPTIGANVNVFDREIIPLKEVESDMWMGCSTHQIGGRTLVLLADLERA